MCWLSTDQKRYRIQSNLHYWWDTPQSINLVSQSDLGWWCMILSHSHIHTLPLRDSIYNRCISVASRILGGNAWYFRIHYHIRTLPLRCNFHNRYILSGVPNLGWIMIPDTSAYCFDYTIPVRYTFRNQRIPLVNRVLRGDTWYSRILTFIGCRWETALIISASH
jgi:hypothetical protein